MAKHDRMEHRRRKEQTTWDRFWLWVKVNEKVFWVVLLVLISFSFAFTGATTTYFGTLGSKSPRLKIDRKVIYDRDQIAANSEILVINTFLADTFRPLRFGEGRDGRLDWVDYLLFQHEADRLGIIISKDELGAAIREIYWGMRAAEDARAANAAAPGGKLDNLRMAWFQRKEDLRKANAWDLADWLRLFRKFQEHRISGVSPRKFETMLANYLKAEKAVDYARNSAQINPDEVYQEYQRREQLRKLSFFELKPDAKLKEEVAAKITDAEIKKHFEDNLDSFKLKESKIQVGHYFIPFEVFEKEAQLTEDDIKSEYLRTRQEKYSVGLNVDESEFNLLSSQDKEAREQKLYKPLEAVRAEVVKDLTRSKSQELARKAADEIRKMLMPEEKPAAPPAGSGENQPAPAAPAKPATAAEVAQKHPYFQAGASEWFTRPEALDKLGNLYTFQVSSWFATADKNAKETDESKKVAIKVAEFWQETQDKDGLVLYHDLKVRYPGLPTSVEPVKDEARDELIKARALDRLRDQAEALAAAIREGKKSFEEAAKEAGAKVVDSPFLKRYGSIQVPDEKAARKKKTEAPGDEPSRPATRPHPGSSLLIGEACAIEEEGKTGRAVRDDDNGAFYIVRLNGKLNPNPEEFKERQKYYHANLLRERQDFYFQSYRKELWARAGVQHFLFTGESEG
ncbi:MAG: hypothetical protein HY717_09550 [Planctomycetes bacterium]|nr:hypothetical protein [Planctomycetota bacterium]